MGSRRRSALLLACAALVLAALLLAGCGGRASPSESRPDQPASLVLDTPPGAVHAGLYLALQRGYDDAEGVHLQVRSPISPSEPLRSLAAGQAQLAIADVHDLALARERGRDVVGVMAFVQTPLAAVLADRSIATAHDLAGRRVGVSGRPADAAVARAIAGGSIRPVRVGFRGVRALRAGRVAAIAGRWTDEGVVLPGRRQFRIDALDPPPYPELVLATSRETLETAGPVVAAAVRALRRGYEAAIDDPDAAVSALLDADPTLTRATTAAQLDAVGPSFTAGAEHFGTFDPAGLRDWAAWEQRVGITKRRPDVAAMFDPAMARAGLTTDPNA
jgi:ABC-type nitrate/sulfonate/bicarbonate transport system substrate-binding protein